jgi:flagellar hook-associated protein 2
MATDIISALGAGSGINTSELVTSLVEAQYQPLQNRLDTRTEQASAQLSAYGIMKSSLAEFEDILTPLTQSALFNAKALNVPTTDVVSFNSLTSEAQAGSYQLEVAQIASAQSIAFNSAEPDAEQALNKAGTLTFNIGEWADDGMGTSTDAFTVDADKVGFSVEITEDDSLSSIAEKINSADSDVQASVIEIDGTQQLLITAESGAGNALEITSDNTAQLGDFEYNAVSIAAQNPASPTAVQTQVGSNAVFSLNGLQVTRESNTVSDAITGLEFTLEKADVGNKVSFSIAQDKSSAEDAIRALVEAYNTLQATLGPLVGVSTDEDNNTVTGGLATDGTAKSLVTRLGQAISSTVNGLDVLDSFSALASVGVTTNLDGTLEIDEEQFSKVISEDFDQLNKLFGLDTSSDSNYVELNTGSFASNAIAGEYTIDVSVSPTKGSLTGNAVAFPLDLTASPLDFTMSLDGETSESIALSGSYTSMVDLTAALQSAINSDVNFKAANLKVDVSDEGGALKITSRSFGAVSNVSIASGALDSIGIDASSVEVNGVNIVGTINGESAFGSGNTLLPDFGSDAYGLNITVKEGAPIGPYQVSFSRGLAGDLALLVSSALADGGQIDAREERIASIQTEIEDDQSTLDRKRSAYQERLASQYQAMEAIIASLDSTKSQLDGLIDRLPFTSTN